MCDLRILLANEPRSYREAMAGAFRVLRPGAEVFVVDPERLDAEVRRLGPQLVICSRTTPTVETRSVSWVELYPEHGCVSVVSVGEECSTVVGIELADLLWIIDQTEGLAQAS